MTLNGPRIIPHPEPRNAVIISRVTGPALTAAPVRVHGTAHSPHHLGGPHAPYSRQAAGRLLLRP
jgi:hypothetical protein